ncbi:carboxyl-terminal protease [Pedobacter heparinus DSM 2366] [Pseudomonas aeruginosa]|nr:carboxyl-terminal protease [Pedobacter heparinus DSM 2366] [Pseudomonas aeruginosa]
MVFSIRHARGFPALGERYLYRSQVSRQAAS